MKAIPQIAWALAATFLLGAGAVAAAPEARVLGRAQKLIASGKVAKLEKAVALLEDHRSEAGTLPPSGELLLAKACNWLSRFDCAFESATRAASFSEAPSVFRAAVLAELAFAQAQDDGRRAALADTVPALREAIQSLGEASAALIRVRLCQARSFLPPQDPLALVADNASAGAPLLTTGGAGTGIEPPRRLVAPVPSAGRHSSLLGTSEKTVLRSRIDTDGCIVRLVVEETTSELWSAVAAQSLSQWVFLPAVRDGRPVAVDYLLTTTFRRSASVANVDYGNGRRDRLGPYPWGLNRPGCDWHDTVSGGEMLPRN